MGSSIQCSDGISVVTENGHVKISGKVKSVTINGVKVRFINGERPTVVRKPFWKIW